MVSESSRTALKKFHLRGGVRAILLSSKNSKMGRPAKDKTWCCFTNTIFSFVRNFNSTVSKSNEHNVRVVMEISMSGLTHPPRKKKIFIPPLKLLFLVGIFEPFWAFQRAKWKFFKVFSKNGLMSNKIEKKNSIIGGGEGGGSTRHGNFHHVFTFF